PCVLPARFRSCRRLFRRLRPYSGAPRPAGIGGPSGVSPPTERWETHLARAQNLYWGYLDYEGALAELEVAAQGLPNDARVGQLKGYIKRRQGRWDESIRDLNRAIELDPRNILTLQQTAQTHQVLRRYVDENRCWHAHWPSNPTTLLQKCSMRSLNWIQKPIPDRCIK